MHIVFIAALLIQTQPPPRISLPNAPTTVSEQATKPHPETTLQIRKTGNVTTPELNQNSPQTPYEMGRDLGGQAESIGELKAQVSSLEQKRENVDRPDINGLKDSRSHFEWIWSMLSAVFATACTVIWYFRRAIWKDSIRPRLAKEIDLELASRKNSSPLPSPPDPQATQS